MFDPGFYKKILDNLREGVYLVDRHRKILYWNRGAEEISGYSAEEVEGAFCYHNLLRHIDGAGNSLCLGACPLAKTMEDGEEREEEIYLHHKKGHRVPVLVRTAVLRDDRGEVVGAVEVFSDNSAKLFAEEEIQFLKRLALADPLTGLANRRYGELQLKSRLAEMERFGVLFGVLFMDLDNFKSVNDSFGHDVGDEVLRMVSRTLLANLRKEDLLCRWGGEEFLAILPHIESTEELAAVGEKMRILVAHSHIASGPELISPQVSVGAAISRLGDTADSIVARADRLMYLSKKKGGNAVTTEAKAAR